MSQAEINNLAYPYYTVTYIEAKFPDGTIFSGSGVMVGPNDILTASHLVYDGAYGGAATSVKVIPGYDPSPLETPYGTFFSSSIDYYPGVDPDNDGLITKGNNGPGLEGSEIDFALVSLNTALGDLTGWMEIDPNFTSGSVNITGYPGFYGVNPMNDSGFIAKDPIDFSYQFGGIEIHSGNSGGPAWYSSGNLPYVVSVVSTQSWGARLAGSNFDQLIAWMQGNDSLIAHAGNVLLGGPGDDRLNGKSGDDHLHSYAGNDTLSGGGGNDYMDAGPGNDAMFGHVGNDTYVIDSALDTISDPGGTDAVWSTAISINLATLAGGGLLENAMLRGPAGLSITGNARDNALLGNRGGNTLLGGDGNDVLGGRGGSDAIDGGNGTDTVLLRGAAADYAFVVSGGAVLAVSKPWWAGEQGEGVDKLTNMETIQFSSGTQSVASISSSGFDTLAYIASYPDLIAAFGTNTTNGLNHFVQSGWQEGRLPTFRALDYIASHPDLMTAFGVNVAAGEQHFITNGSSEGRKVTFSAIDYLASYRDLAMVFGSDTDAAAAHYIQNGRPEDRNVLRHVGIDDGLEYIASNPDLAAAFGANSQAGVVHYLRHGEYEGRTQSFDGLAYLANNPDLFNAFEGDAGLGARHYIEIGRLEERATFNALRYAVSDGDLI